MKDKSLQNARQDWFIAEIKRRKFHAPVAELSAIMECGQSLVSELLNKKASISDKFFRKFCEVYKIDTAAIDASLNEKINKQETTADTKNNPQKKPIKDNNDDPPEAETLMEMLNRVMAMTEKNQAISDKHADAAIINARASEENGAANNKAAAAILIAAELLKEMSLASEHETITFPAKKAGQR